jgi:hypothetical protein
MVGIGDQAPGFELQAVGGGIRALAEALRGRQAVILVFLRHLG